jgi:hypothetical protein
VSLNHQPSHCNRQQASAIDSKPVQQTASQCNRKQANATLYRVIRKSLRDLEPLRYSSRDGHDGGGGGACQQRERHTKFLSYLTGARHVHPLWRGRRQSCNQVRATPVTQNAFLSPVHAMFRHDCPLAVKPASTPRRLLHKKKKKTWRDSLPIDMLLSAVSVFVVALPSSAVPEGLMSYPV